MFKNRRVSIDISIGSIFWILLSLAAVFVAIQLSWVIVLLFCSILITLAICPLVDTLEKFKIKRGISSIVILLAVFGTVIFLAVSIATPLIDQTQLFIQRLPAIIEAVSPIKFIDNSINAQFASVPGKVINFALDTFSGFITAFTVIVLSYYMIQEMYNLQKYLVFWFGEKGLLYNAIAEKLEVQIGNWVRGELFLMLIVGLLSYSGYLIIGLPFALPLAFMAGLLELIPNIGPTIATVPAVLVGLSISPNHGLAALILSIIVQQLENNLIVPKVMQRVTGLNPIITIIAIMVGYELGGPLIAILALPIVLSTRVVLSHVRLNKDTTIPEID
jgi:predicted PurR-regulated permease PerM